jgi:hypothetical protein
MQPNLPTPRPDIDIEEDLHTIIRNYAPLQMSRPYFSFKSHDGIIHINGTVRTPQTRRVLVENAARISGVRGIDDSDLYDDDQVRVEVGSLLPPGAYASVHGGVVALTGSLPANQNVSALVEAISHLPGVRRVGAAMEPAVH